jgi:hypothetical protein
VVSAAIIVAATLGPSSQQGTPEWLCVLCGELGSVDFVLNVLLFAPLGFGLSLAGVRPARAVLAMIAATIAIETLQVFVVPGRDASVGDVIANSTGGTLGYAVRSRLATLLWPRAATARRLLTAWLAAWLVLQTTAGYAVGPQPSTGRYYGRLGRASETGGPYPGQILQAGLNGAPIPDMHFPAQGAAVDALSRGTDLVLQLTVAPGPPVRWAKLAQIVDFRADEVLLSAAKGHAFVFGMRSAAAKLRLRSTHFQLHGAFRDAGTAAAPIMPETLRLSAAYAPPRVVLTARGRGRQQEAVILLSASASWRLFSPFQTYFDGSLGDDLLNAAWLFVLLFPAGYWAGHVGERRGMIGIAVALALVLGLSIGPLLFHLRIAAWSETLGVLAGVAAGARAAGILRRRMPGDDSFPLAAFTRASHSHPKDIA